MSASVVAADLRHQNWFMNSSQDIDPLSYHHHNHDNCYQPNTTTTTNHSMPSSHSKHLFGTSIFGAPPSSYSTTHISAHSPLVPPSCAPLTNTHNHHDAHNRSPSISPPDTPSIDMDQMSSINHLITTLSYAIQEMNQYLDNTTTCKAINAKTTNCRNEMVSTLSYYQTYIQSKSPHIGSRSLSLQIDIDSNKPTLLLDHTPHDKDPYYPLDQGLEFERTTYGASTSSSSSRSHSNTDNNAKAIALDVVQHIIGTPGPLITDESIPTHDVSPPPLAATPPNDIANSQQMDEKEQEHKLKSTLNAYAPPYESVSAYTNTMMNGSPVNQMQNQTQTTPSNMRSPRYIQQSLTSPSVTSKISSPTQTYLMHQFQQNNNTSTQHNIQQYYNTLAVQQRATKPTQTSPEYSSTALLLPQNRIINRNKKGAEDAKELEAYLDIEEEDDDAYEDDDYDDEDSEETMEALAYNLQNIIDLAMDDEEDKNIAQNHNNKAAHTMSPLIAANVSKTTKVVPINTHKANKSTAKPPLWSAIAKHSKQVAKAPTMIHSHPHSTKVNNVHNNNNNEDEKSPELTNNDNYNKRHWNNKRHSTHNYSSERSSASSHSSSSSSHNNNNNNNNNIATTHTNSNTSHRTPSPSPEHNHNHNNNVHNAHNTHHNHNTHHRDRNVTNHNYHRHTNNNHPKAVQNGKNERCRVFVSNLPPNVTDEDIRNAFAHCGDIANTVWFPSRTDGKFYGSGLITFGDGSASKEALKMNQQNVLGRIIRCEYSSCQDPVKVKPPGCRTIYLNNVPRDAHESRIRQVFKHCGKIKRVRFHERDTKRTGGAFVEFENTSSCDKALDLHGKIVDNHPLYVDYQRY